MSALKLETLLHPTEQSSESMWNELQMGKDFGGLFFLPFAPSPPSLSLGRGRRVSAESNKITGLCVLCAVDSL